ncbi:nucleoside recognition domain-containing protein [Paenibacillus humicus]|uniref:nucleoside recognition domain-containing protein n=1 Tax=Paenibacillus humicus TaxID=412861 RepID=UPI000FDC9D23|nr:nucleoside recognition domain-containing protein [Paenibacillus humicus]
MLRTLLTACAAVLLVAAIVGGTSEAFQASLSGLSLWWNFVFPSLLPFLVLAELMLAFGLVDAIGAMLAPLTTRLLRLPGAAGWGLVQGWTGGFPAGAQAAASLVSSGRLTRSEGQRLLAAAHLPNPLFVIVVVGAGFLHQPRFGLMLIPVLWLSSLIAGMIVSIGIRKPAAVPLLEQQAQAEGGKGAAWRIVLAMEEGRKRDGRSFGKALGDGVAGAVQQLMNAGGLIILAAVVIRLLQPFLPEAVQGPLLISLAEVHLGTNALASWHAPEPSSLLQTAAIAAALSWGGLCSLLQAAGTSSGTGLRLLPLAGARLLASAIAAGLTLVLWIPLSALASYAETAVSSARPAFLIPGISGWEQALPASLWPSLPYSAAAWAVVLAALLLLSAAVRGLRRRA